MKRYVLIGLDGSGKSANLNRMKQDPLFDGFRFAWVRWEPKLLLPMRRLLRKRAAMPAPAKDAKASDAAPNTADNAAAFYRRKLQLKKKIFSCPLVGKLWMGAALIDYLPQFYRKYNQMKRSDGNIIFDRYYFDLFVDQGLNIGYSPQRIADTIHRYRFLFPKATRVIYIRATPAVCFSRKEDIPDMDYLERRYAVYELLHQQNQWTAVDAEAPLEEVYRSIRTSILD